jgi:hypothetical protein
MTVTEKRSTATILVEHISAPIIKCTANKTFTVGDLDVKAGQDFFLVQSGSDEHRYYVVVFINSSWTCSCGAKTKVHAHNKAVKSWIIEHVVKPRQAAILAAAVAGDKTYEQAIEKVQEDAYEILGPTKDLEAARDFIAKMECAPLNGNAGFSLLK